LESGLKWDPNLTPAFEVPDYKITARGASGHYGEDLVARTALGRGEIVLDTPVGPEDRNQRGPDLITLAERGDGLVIKLYDNKAFQREANVASVPSLMENLPKNLQLCRESWSKYAADETGSMAERNLFATAAGLVSDEHCERIVANYYGRSSGVTERLRQAGIEFEEFGGRS
jgi:hypothetical protein